MSLHTYTYVHASDLCPDQSVLNSEVSTLKFSRFVKNNVLGQTILSRSSYLFKKEL